MSPRTSSEFSPGENRVAAYLRTVVKATRKQEATRDQLLISRLTTEFPARPALRSGGTMFLKVSYGSAICFACVFVRFQVVSFVLVSANETKTATRLLQPRISGFHL